jgi:hypothetical protein
VPGLLWEDLAGSFAVDASVKTVYIEGAGSMTTWQALADWVCTHGPDYRYPETGPAGPGLPIPAVQRSSPGDPAWPGRTCRA